MPYHRKTAEQFVKDARLVHGDKYEYSDVEYVNTHTPVKIKCMSCGNIFFQEPSSHLAGHGCPKCNKRQDGRKISQEDFVARAKEVHKNKYDYSKTEYSDMRSKVEIICPVHGPFFQRAQSHLLGHGCPKCKYDNHIARIKKIMEQLDLQ